MVAQSSRRLSGISPSPTLAISARAKELSAAGKSILNLSAGEPDFPTPKHICEAAVAAISAGDTHYTPVDGTSALKRAIAAKLQRENGLEYSLASILVSCGAKQALFNLCMALLDPGDQVVIPAPYWVSYPPMARIAEAIPVTVACPAGDGFKLTPESLSRALNERTRLLVLNSPGNPSGAVYTRKELQAIAELLADHPRIVVASDDIYEHLLYADDEPFCDIAMAAPALRERCVVINGVSKAYAMTGWRIGYAAGPEWLIAAMKKLQSQSTSNPASVSQAAAVAALEGPQDCVRSMRDAFRNRRDKFVAGLNSLPGIRCAPPAGAFYAFADCREAIASRRLDDDVQLCEFLLDAAGVAAVPGSAFGASGFVRFSYAADQKTLDAALEGLDAALRRAA